MFKNVRKRIRRERATLSPTDSDLLWYLVGQLEHLHPVRLLYYLVNSEHVGGSEYTVESKSTDDEGQPKAQYRVDLSRHWCSCPASTHNNTCDHVRAMRLRSGLQTQKPRKGK